MRQPPENVFVANCWRAEVKPSPARMLAARDSALSESISVSLEWISVNVISRPSLSSSSLAASFDVSAIVARSSSMDDSWAEIF